MNGSPVAAVVRGWVDLYTRGLPADARAARRDEIDDDLWCEHAEAAATDRSARSLDADLALRLILGIPSDLSWRLTHHRAPDRTILEKRASRGTRILGLLAIVAASSLFTLPILTGGTSEPVWAWVLVPIGSAIAFLAAAFGLALQFGDRIGRLGAFGAILVALGFAAIIGAYVAGLALLPVGSAMLMGDLARIGVISRRAAIAHLATVGILLPGLAVVLITQTDFAIAVVGAVSYLLSWIAIGVSLFRGVPKAQATTG
ncbi:MAG TPA: hypothetical protein VFU17_00150 [Candidatus Limnocylindrales bacterium]|nr:hypothetical protein [Candidatus Limnocylindrales bacterium]